jgi:predicted house-cleaning noncanonical NTP pyrophosphatase (MazG superfamily)
MILNRFVNEGTIENIYDSTNVLASKYDSNKRKLAIIFGSGQQYVYHEVTTEDYKKFEEDDSQGKAIHKYIKKYKSEKSTDLVDVSVIKEQVINLKNNG